jgi:3-oxoacyl-[acyl-carrier protein] reductase
MIGSDATQHADLLGGRTALITGAGSGIGRATALRLAADGARWVGCLDRDAASASRVAAEIADRGGQAGVVSVDVTDAASVADVLAATITEQGGIDLLVNNAGIPGGGRFVDLTFQDWQRVLDVHVSGTFHVTKAVLPGMLARRWGRIITITSESVWLGNQSVQYVTAKAALVGFTRALATQVAGDGVLVNAVAPGPVETPMLRDNEPAMIEAELATVRIGRFLEPAEVAATIAFLAGPGGDVFVGQVLSPNGGTVYAG